MATRLESSTRHYDERLQQILKASAIIFAEKGFHRTSIRDIARRTGLSLAGGRDADSIRLACCLPVEVTQTPVPQEEGRLMGHPDQLIDALRGYEKVGVEHLSLQFMTPRWPDRLEQMERFAQEVLPAL